MAVQVLHGVALTLLKPCPWAVPVAVPVIITIAITIDCATWEL